MICMWLESLLAIADNLEPGSSHGYAPINVKPAGGEAGHGMGIWLSLLALG